MNKKNLIVILLFFVVLLTVIYTTDDYGIAWDEPQYFHSSDLIMKWFSMVGNSLTKEDVSDVISDKTIKKYWHWDPEHVPHPPFSRILSGITKTIFSPLVGSIAYRFSTAFFFAMLTVIVFLWMSELYDIKTGIFSALSVFLMPHLFGHAHFAMTDIPLTTMWFLTVYCFYRGLTDWRWSIVLGIVFELSLSTKFPAFLIPMPLFLWAHIYRRKEYHNNAFSMIFISPIVMIATQPYLWHRTLPRIIEFVYDSTTRLYTFGKSFTTYFLHNTYLSDELPWFYPFFITVVTIPLTILSFSVIGILFTITRERLKNDTSVLFLMNAILILLLPLMPGAVIHDGTRLLLPAFSFIAVLAGVGFYHLFKFFLAHLSNYSIFSHVNNLNKKVAAAIFIVVFSLPAINIIAIHPYELSYYNILVGGIKGANKLGLETTYLQEVITPSFLESLNRELPQNARLNASFSNFMMEIYQKNGMLRKDIKIVDSINFDFYMLLNRQGQFNDFERWLVTHTPYMVVQIHSVPLIFLYKM